MQLTIATRELRDAVAGLSRLIPGRTTLPVLHGVRMRGDAQGVTAQATDLDSTVTFSFRDAGHSGTGAFVLDLDHIKALSKGGPDDMVCFDADAPDRVAVTTQAGGQPLHRTLPAIAPEEWPAGTDADVKTAPVPAFLETFRMLEPFASKDITRYTLQGVHLDVGDHEPDGSVMVATDGRRLASRNHMTLPLSESCILRSSKFLAWSRLPADAEVGLSKTKAGSTIGVKAGPWAFTTKAIEGTFPNWRQVVPAQATGNRMRIAENDVRMLLKALPSLPQSRELILVGRGGGVSIWVHGEDSPDWTTLTLPESRHEGAAVAYSILDRVYVREALEAGLVGTVSFENELSPVLSVNDNGGTHVLMPMHGCAPAAITEELERLRASEAGVEGKENAEPGESPQPHTATEAPAATPEPPEHKQEGARMNQDKTTPAPAASQPAANTTALDRALDAFEQAKTAVREAAALLATLAAELKTAVRDQKAQAADLDRARGTLAKLQSISL